MRLAIGIICVATVRVHALIAGWVDRDVFWNDPCIFRPTNRYQASIHVHSHSYGNDEAASTTITGSSSTAITVSPTNVEPCASISMLVVSYQDANPNSSPTVPARLGYDCLTSIPFNSSAAVALLDSMRPYLEWQTTLSYVRNPPLEYAEKMQPPYDFWGAFETIYYKAQAVEYTNEYDFGWAVYVAFQAAHDGHFIFLPDVVGDLMTFGRTTPLVSISADGFELPKIYTHADILTASAQNFTPSPVVMIDGQNATEFLLNWAGYGALQDNDALWNNLFVSSAQISLGEKGTSTGTFCGGGRGRWVFPGPTTILTFQNGTSVTTENFARILVPFAKIASGEDIYQKHFVPPSGQPMDARQAALSITKETTTSSASKTLSLSDTAPSSPVAPGYPMPVICEMNNLNSGYFLDEEGYTDLAVLSVPSFVDPREDEIPFQAVNTHFLNLAVAEGKTKLIIDLSANAGGTILQGYDLFKQLFPDILPYGANRFRAHEAFDLIGQEVSHLSGLVRRSDRNNATMRDLTSSAMNYRTDVQKSYQPFPDWPTKFGPHSHHVDNFTSIMRWNMTDVLTPDNSGGIYVSGYLNRSNITTAPFAPENIIIVTDGYCASTCSLFVELMKSQGGVKTIALGGRPNRDPIQAVGGVKGANDHTWHSIFSKAQIPFQYQSLHDANYYGSTALGRYNNLWQWRTSLALINVRDAILDGDDDEVPSHFVYQPADCRIFYTADMVLDQTVMWTTVADTAFGGAPHCVAGSLPGVNSVASSVSRRRQHQSRADEDRQEHM